jgi:hypothetical protein
MQQFFDRLRIVPEKTQNNHEFPGQRIAYDQIPEEAALTGKVKKIKFIVQRIPLYEVPDPVRGFRLEE